MDGFRRRKGSKVHALVTARGLPLRVLVGPANQPGLTLFQGLLEGVRLKGKRGRPRTRPGEVWADGAYRSREVRLYLRRRGIKASIPQNPRGRKRPKVGRPYRFCQASYQAARGAVERFFAWRKGGFRRLALRHERLLGAFTAFLYLACFIITWRVLR